MWLLDLDSDDEAKDHVNSLPDVEAVSERPLLLPSPIAPCRPWFVISLTLFVQEIEDFTDVTPGQKRFMKIWNHFLAHKMDGVCMAPKQLPIICLEFAQYFALHSTCDDDEEQFIRSLFNLMDENYLGCLQVEQIMKAYRQARKSSPRETAAVIVSSSFSPNYKEEEEEESKKMQATLAKHHDSHGADESDSDEWTDPDDGTLFEF